MSLAEPPPPTPRSQQTIRDVLAVLLIVAGWAGLMVCAFWWDEVAGWATVSLTVLLVGVAIGNERGEAAGR